MLGWSMWREQQTDRHKEAYGCFSRIRDPLKNLLHEIRASKGYSESLVNQLIFWGTVATLRTKSYNTNTCRSFPHTY
jgi:hypothetical protein